MGCSCSADVREVECAICCMDIVDNGVRVVCSNNIKNHTICQDCFTNQVAAWSDLALGDCNKLNLLLKQVSKASNPQPSVRLCGLAKACVGNIPCFSPGCDGVIPCVNVLPQISSSNGSKVLVRYNVAKRHQIDKLDAQIKISTREENGGHQLSVMKRDRTERQLFVEDEILTLQCPKCKLAVVDFDGCFAVQCSGCSIWFCAWCLIYTGDCNGAHKHVAECPENQKPDKDVWGTMTEFNAHHDTRRTKKVTSYLIKQNDAHLNDRVLPLLKVTLGRAACETVKKSLPVVKTMAPTRGVDSSPKTVLNRETAVAAARRQGAAERGFWR